jgi:DNA-binding NtrC family response regulator
MATASAVRRLLNQPPHGPSRNVLLVDESAHDLRAYAEVLRRQGWEVRACESFHEGKLCLEGGSFDIVIVSQGSPAFEGRSLLERAIEIDRSTPVFVVAASVDIGSYLEAMQLGARDYIQKPLSANELLQMVRDPSPPSVGSA